MTKEPKTGNKIVDWIEYRLPIFSFMKHSQEYRTPKNLSYAWNFGSLAGLALMIQIVTGIVLAMHYTPHSELAFDSVENIMRNVNYGWLIRYIHAVGASMFFLVTYLHIARGLYYGSYKKPRELLWWFGIIIFISMMATAFMGYVLPWGQMSYWGATVITNLFSAIPGIGDAIVTFLWGGYSVDNPTLNRFFSLHYLMPFVILGLVVIHIVALHHHGSNNPTGVEPKKEKDTIPFHPYYTIKDFFGFGVFFIVFGYFVFFDPNYLGHPDNYIPADPLVTPPHIVPEWYFLPFYAILRAIPDKLGGVLFMFGAILILFILPWLDTSKVKSGRYRPVFRVFYWLFILNFIFLGWLGQKSPDGFFDLTLFNIEALHFYAEGSCSIIFDKFDPCSNLFLSQASTAYYFLYFVLALPLLGRFEKTKPEPKSISDDYKKNKK